MFREIDVSHLDQPEYEVFRHILMMGVETQKVRLPDYPAPWCSNILKRMGLESISNESHMGSNLKSKVESSGGEKEGAAALDKS